MREDLVEELQGEFKVWLIFGVCESVGEIGGYPPLHVSVGIFIRVVIIRHWGGIYVRDAGLSRSVDFVIYDLHISSEETGRLPRSKGVNN